MSNKTYGLNKERELKHKFENDPGVLSVVRSRGSFGKFDLVVFYENYLKLISVKSTKQKYYNENKEIERIKKTKLPKYAEAWLYVYYTPRKDRDKKGWNKIRII